MYTAQKFIDDILDQSAWFDMNGDCEELLQDWYGDDFSLAGADDEDLGIAFNRLRNTYTFWRTGAEEKSPYHKLRLKFDALFEAYMQLADDFKTICDDNLKLEKACQKNKRNVIATQIKGGCDTIRERRIINHDNISAA